MKQFGTEQSSEPGNLFDVNTFTIWSKFNFNIKKVILCCNRGQFSYESYIDINLAVKQFYTEQFTEPVGLSDINMFFMKQIPLKNFTELFCNRSHFKHRRFSCAAALDNTFTISSRRNPDATKTGVSPKWIDIFVPAIRLELDSTRGLVVDFVM